MEEGKRQAMEVAEDARQEEWESPSFVADLFLGQPRWDMMFPYPEQSLEDKREGDEFIARLEKYLKENLDADEVDRTGHLPAENVKGLAALGCFGMKISKEYGGLGLSQVNYNRAISAVATYCGSTSVWLSAHQSIGVPQPLKLFGTDEQKKKFLPRFSQGAVSAFALTEVDVGSDPAQMKTTAVPVEDGKYYLINGEKLWCTNGPDADILVVMAQTPPKIVNGREKKQITAFIVEKGMPGFETAHRCEFMGIRGISNGVLRFKDVKVPAENMIWEEGKGLKLALTTLNIGRLTVPAACVGIGKMCLRISREWCGERFQWGSAVGRHENVGVTLARMAADCFAMDAVTWWTSAMVDEGQADIRLEAGMAKLFCTETSWRIADDCMQLRGGRGYETAKSLKGRGEKCYPVERILRDTRINRIIEGTTEILHLFLAREALDAHLSLAMPLMNPKASAKEKASAFKKAAAFYANWYPRRWLNWTFWPKHQKQGSLLGHHLRYVERTSHRLARALFHNCMVYQAKLEKRQRILFRLMDVGTELFAMASTIALAKSRIDKREHAKEALKLADLFCRDSRRRVERLFEDHWDNSDSQARKIADGILDDEYKWLEAGIIDQQF
ncbi:MAG: acyl-CoA dehydrogenase family protein [Candidatus Omnitrophica bacterium]|nr:acyl-CoA dehydrogenase family protein [Candidatus Omnitrophota bacterium]